VYSALLLIRSLHNALYFIKSPNQWTYMSYIADWRFDFNSCLTTNWLTWLDKYLSLLLTLSSYLLSCLYFGQLWTCNTFIYCWMIHSSTAECFVKGVCNQFKIQILCWALVLCCDFCLVDNGFNPVWNESCEFDIFNPEVALMRFVVQDEDVFGEPNFLGQATIPVRSIRTGKAFSHCVLNSLH